LLKKVSTIATRKVVETLMQDLIVEIREKCKLRNGFAIWHLSLCLALPAKRCSWLKKCYNSW